METISINCVANLHALNWFRDDVDAQAGESVLKDCLNSSQGEEIESDPLKRRHQNIDVAGCVCLAARHRAE
ncbi:MAG: hypothetical protein QM759_01520 [Terricaulis sp.]